MSDGNLQEWEEYDARMPDDSPVAGGTLATQRSKSEFRHAPIERPAALEGPFLLGNAGELASETEGIAWETAGSPSVGTSPQFRTEETEVATHNSGCGCGRSTSFPGFSETEVFINSLSESLGPMTHSEIIDRAFKDSRDSLGIALGHLRKLRDGIKGLPVTSDPAFNSAFVNLLSKHKRNIAVLSKRLMIVPPDPSGAEFRDKLDRVIDLCDRNLALGKTILDAGTTGRCAPSNPCTSGKGPYWACSDPSQPDPKTHVCDMFFNASPDLQRDVITHEYFHLLGLGDNSVNNTADAMRNANTIAQIVAFLTDRSRQKNSDGREPAVPPLPLDKEVQDFENVFKRDTLYGSEDHESLVDEVGGNGWRAESFEFDPYTTLRPALRPEHASLAADELTVIVGRQPTLIALHRMLASPDPQTAVLAALLGRAGRRSMRLGGTNVPIPVYLRRLSRLCSEAAEYTETEAGPRMEGQVATPPPPPKKRNITEDAFFEDEWAPEPTILPNPRNVHFNRFTTLTATTLNPQSVLTGKRNPLDPRVTPGLLQPEVIPAKRAVSHEESYWIYVPPAFQKAVKDALAADTTPPTARVSVLFGVGAEVNRHGLRSFFESTADRILIEVGGIESRPESPDPWGIGITDSMIADLLQEALGTRVSAELEVLAAYSTGYSGLNGTINNGLVGLTHLQKLVFYDCLYRGDQPKAPKGAAMPAKRHPGSPGSSAFNTWRAIQAVLSASSGSKIVVYDVTPGGTPTYADGARRVEIPGATFIELKPFNVELKAIILARLMDNGIKDGYFTVAKVPAGIRALIPLLPKRGTLSSASSAATPGTIGEWAKANSRKIAESVSGFAVAMELSRKNELMGWPTPATEFGHDGFLPEFGWEHLAG
jgi:hypothetical protein